MNGQDPEEFIQEEGEMEVTKEMQSDDGQGQGPNEPIFNEGEAPSARRYVPGPPGATGGSSACLRERSHRSKGGADSKWLRGAADLETSG